jgi:hypothetical protein
VPPGRFRAVQINLTRNAAAASSTGPLRGATEPDIGLAPQCNRDTPGRSTAST